MSIIARGEESLRVKEVDKNARYKWLWRWMEQSITVDVADVLPNRKWQNGPIVISLKEHMRKIDVKGKARCVLCNCEMVYGNKGITRITDHLKTQGHVAKVLDEKENSLQPGVSDPSQAAHAYGAPPAYYEIARPSAAKPRSSVHILDRKANMEALLVSCLAEKSLPFTLAGSLLLSVF